MPGRGQLGAVKINFRRLMSLKISLHNPDNADDNKILTPPTLRPFNLRATFACAPAFQPESKYLAAAAAAARERHAQLAAAAGGARAIAAAHEHHRLFIVGYLVLSFWLFYHGMRFVAKFPGLGAVLTERLLYMLFAFLFALLLLSNLVISYTNLFRNRETAFLLTLPVSTQTIFRWKFIESTMLASWAFLFLIAPLLAAFGLVRDVPWHFYSLTILLIGLFIVLPGVSASALAIWIGRYLDRRSFQICCWCSALVLLAFVAFWWKTQAGRRRTARQAHAGGARPIAGQDALHDVSVSAELLAVVGVLQWAEGILRGAVFSRWCC